MEYIFASIVIELWLLAFIVGAAALIAFEVGKNARRAKRKWRPRRDVPRTGPFRQHAGPQDAADQLRSVSSAEFRAKRVLSPTEAHVLRAAEASVRELQLDWRVMAQVSLGEVLSSPDEAAFRAINAKRVDLLVISADCRPLAAIEYQGSGHHLGDDASARDAVKKEALRRANIAFIEVRQGDHPEDVRRALARLAATFGKGLPQSPKGLAREAA